MSIHSDTKRVVSPGAEKWLGVTQRVLNDGEIELIDYMGTEEQMVGIARISHGSILPHTDAEKAQKLINYFMANAHTSPFEFNEVVFRWRLPIFVARQVVRHRTANINEKSARYSEMDANLYVPEFDDIKGQDTKNKQGSIGELPESTRREFIDGIQTIEMEGRQFYLDSMAKGISKEMARIHLPVGTYTDWVWKMDLHNLFHFLGLRLDAHAQFEVRVYAEAIYRVIKEAYPLCSAAFEEFKLFAKTLPASDIEILKRIVLGSIEANAPEVLALKKKLGLI